MASREDPSLYANLNGIPTQTSSTCQICFRRAADGAWRSSELDLAVAVEDTCVSLHDELARAIFGDLQKYYKDLYFFPSYLAEAGLNSECPLSVDEFEHIIGTDKGTPDLHNALYLYDCRKLVSGIQECAKEVWFLQGEFYRALNFEELFYPPATERWQRFVASPVTAYITATLNFIFIRIHSLLDYTAKLFYEIEHLRTDFTVYPRLACANIQFGDRKRLGANGSPGSLFEDCHLVCEIETIRNLIIHDGLLDDMPKIYKVVEGGKVTEKFILFPDMVSGRLTKFKNRSLFFSRENKINLRLPSLVSAFRERQVLTLDRALGALRRHPGPKAAP